jgi:hypothetical protein
LTSILYYNVIFKGTLEKSNSLKWELSFFYILPQREKKTMRIAFDNKKYLELQSNDKKQREAELEYMISFGKFNFSDEGEAESQQDESNIKKGDQDSSM